MTSTLPSILALDLASTVGWAAESQGAIQYGSRQFDITDFGGLCWRFEKWLADMILEHEPGIVAIERPFYRGAGSTVYLLGGMAFVAQGVAYGHELERREQPVMSILRWLAGKVRLGPRTATKAAVIEAVRRRGYQPEDDNQADALALLLYTRNQENEAGRLALEA